MVHRGRVRNGRVEFDAKVTLPEGAVVELSVIDQPQSPEKRRPRVLELIDRWYSLADGVEPAYWDELEREVSQKRLSFRDVDPSV